ncbi:hypothetical protein E2542_SST10124 [Spatholobus suberectus]|nr:hypothetical protein E2542_SST10124 [Spatholobus suberectus]
MVCNGLDSILVYDENTVMRTSPRTRDTHFPCILIFTVPEFWALGRASHNGLVLIQLFATNEELGEYQHRQ